MLGEVQTSPRMHEEMQFEEDLIKGPECILKIQFARWGIAV
jgi:hypothetical protein